MRRVVTPNADGEDNSHIGQNQGTIGCERSDDFAFDTDLVSFRAILRTDGATIDSTGAIKYFEGNAA